MERYALAKEETEVNKRLTEDRDIDRYLLLIGKMI